MKDAVRPAGRPFVMCVGSAALDLVMAVEALPLDDQRVPAQTAVLSGGGPAATAAVAMSRLGTPVSFVGSVGNDDAGALIRDGLARSGVDLTHLTTVEGMTSPMSAGLVRSSVGTRALAAYRDSHPAIEVTPAIEALARAAAWIHADHAGFPVVRELRRRGVETPVSLDGGNPIVDLDLRLVDLYVPAAPELLRWTGTATVAGALEAAYRRGTPVVVATQGETGSSGVSAVAPEAEDVTAAFQAARVGARPTSPWTLLQPAFAVTPVASTLGAGDVFHGALVSAIVDGLSLRESMRRASAAAALSCRSIDGRSAIPTNAEINTLIASAPAAAQHAVSAWS
jgi:sulfofructose kinase